MTVPKIVPRDGGQPYPTGQRHRDELARAG